MIGREGTLRFTPKYLKWGTEYVAIVRNLRAFNNMGVSVPIAESEIYFTTAQLPHRLVASNLGPGQTICNGDTFELRFSRKLDALSTMAGNIVQLRRVVVDSTHGWGDSVAIVTLSQSLNSDSTVITATPSTALLRGMPYLLEVRGDFLTGDTTDHILIPLNANLHGRLTLSKSRYGGGALTSTTRIFPDAGERYVNVGDSIQLMAGYPGPGFAFKYWSSPGNTAIHLNTNASLKIAQTCRDLAVVGVFEAIATDSVRAYADSLGKAVLYSSSWDSLTANNGSLVLREDSVWAIAVPDSGYVFDKWESPNSSYNNLTDRIIPIRNSGAAVSVRAKFKAPIGLVDYSYCGAILNPAGVATTIATLSPSCTTSTTPGQSATITATVLDPNGANSCYRIVHRVAPDGTPQDHRPVGGVTEDALAWPLLMSGPVVRFVLAKREFTLSVNKQMEDNSEVPKEAYVIISPDKQKYECGENVVLTAFDDVANGVKFLRWEPSMSTSKTLAVTMDENKAITAIFESEFKLTGHEYYIGSETATTVREPFQNALNVQILPLSPPTTFMILHFNRPVNDLDLTSSSGESKIRAVETSRRIDSKVIGFGREQTYSPQSVDYVLWSDDKKSVKLKLTNSATGLSIRKFQEVHVFVADLTSNTGVRMKPLGGPLYMHTETPDVIWAIDPVEIYYDQDPGGSGEIFSGWVAGRHRESGNTMLPGRDPSANTRSISAPPTQTFAINLQTIPSIGSTDMLSAGVVTIDEDGGKAVNQILTAVQGVANGVAAEGWVSAEVKLGAKIVGAIAGAMKDATWDNDDYVGSASWFFGPHSLWGYNASPGELNIYDNTAGFKLKVTLQ